MAEVTIEDVGPCKKHLTIIVPQAEVQAKINENYERLKDAAVVDGFRKGHVPRKLLERRFGEEVLEEVKQAFLSESSENALEENNLKALGTPSFDNVEFDPTKDFVFEITLEVEPEFELTEYKGISLQRKANEVSDDEIARGLENMRMQRATLELQPHDTAVAAHDQIVCDWELTSEDESVASEKDDQVLVQGKRWGGVELEQEIADMLAGAVFEDKRQAKGTVLESYPIEKWRGKDCLLSLTVKEIRRPVLPELNEEFAASMDFDSMAELTAYARRSIQQSKERSNALDLEKQLFDHLLATMPFDLPEGVLKAQARNIMVRHQYRLRMRGMPQDEIDQHLEEMRDASEEAAERNLKVHFILTKIAEKEKIFVTENDVQNRIASMANQYRLSVPKMQRQIEQDGSMAELRGGMREDKTIELLLKNAEITDDNPAQDDSPKE